MKNNNWFFGILLSLLLSCNSSNVEKKTIETYVFEEYSNNAPKIVCELEVDVEKTGQCLLFDSLGNVLSSTMWNLGKQHGSYKTFYSSGVLKEHSMFIEGEATGKSRHYYDDGLLKVEANMVNGKLNGKMEVYFDNGLLMQESFSVDNQRVGEFKEYHKNGSVKEISYRKLETLDSSFIQFYSNSQKSVEGQFSNGQQIGTWIYYDTTGVEEKRITF